MQKMAIRERKHLTAVQADPNPEVFKRVTEFEDLGKVRRAGFRKLPADAVEHPKGSGAEHFGYEYDRLD